MWIDWSFRRFYADEDAEGALREMESASEIYVVVIRREYGTSFYVFERESAIDLIKSFLAVHGSGPDVRAALDLHERDGQPGVAESQIDSAPEYSVVLKAGTVIGVLADTPPRPEEDRPMIYLSGPPVFEMTAGDEQESVREEGSASAEPPEEEPIKVRGEEGSEEPIPEPPQPSRFLVARADESVKVGIPFTLMARIDTKNAATVAGGIGVPATGGAPISGDVSGKLKISIFAPGFTSNDGTQRDIDVPPAGNSPWASFELVANKDGVQEIEVLAWRNSVQVGGVTLTIGVGVGAVGAGQAQGNMDMRDPEEGEFTLEISFDATTNQYRFQLRSDRGDTWPPMFSQALVDSARANYESVVKAMNIQARNVNKLTPFAQEEWLKSMGKTLYTSLLPADLRQVLWDNQSNIKFLNILSPGEPMPWELLYLTDPGGAATGSFIADAATVTRWRYGPPPGRQLKKGNPYFVLPQGSPAKAAEEVKYVQQKLGSGNIVATLDDLLRLLQAANFSLLHFASHNVTNPSATAGLYVPFQDGQFDMTFAGGWVSKQFVAQSPLVFMNACTTGGAAPLYTEMAGWADKFLGAGCAAFIGSLWEVRDTSALTFSETFYDQVTAGSTLSAAMRAARNELRKSDPTYLAYTLYGNPLARLI